MTDQFVIVGSNLIWNAKDELLLVKEGKEQARGQWNLPGGTLEHGERPRDCAVREAKEEVQLVIEPDRFVGIYLGTGDVGTQKILNCCYESRITGQKAAIDPKDTVIDFQWLAPVEIEDQDLRAAYIPEAITDVQTDATASDTVISDCYT